MVEFIDELIPTLLLVAIVIGIPSFIYQFFFYKKHPENIRILDAGLLFLAMFCIPATLGCFGMAIAMTVSFFTSKVGDVPSTNTSDYFFWMAVFLIAGFIGFLIVKKVYKTAKVDLGSAYPNEKFYLLKAAFASFSTVCICGIALAIIGLVIAVWFMLLLSRITTPIYIVKEYFGGKLVRTYEKY